MEQWEKNYYISSIAGAVNGSSLVVMSKGLIITLFCNIYRFMMVYPTPFCSLHIVSTIFMYYLLLRNCSILPIIVTNHHLSTLFFLLSASIIFMYYLLLRYCCTLPTIVNITITFAICALVIDIFRCLFFFIIFFWVVHLYCFFFVLLWLLWHLSCV